MANTNPENTKNAKPSDESVQDEPLQQLPVATDGELLPCQNDLDQDDIQIVEDPKPPKKRKKLTTKTVVLFAIFLALVVLFQFVGSYIKIGTSSLCLVLIPIVLGGVVLGPLGGFLLGLAFGLVTFVGAMTSPTSVLLFSQHPILTTMTLLLKGSMAGLIPALIYKAIAKKHPFAAVVTASALAPIINTGIFILGALTMSKTLAESYIESGMSVIYYIVIVCVGVNFFIEFAINIIAAPAIHSLIRIFNKHHKR